MWKTVLNSILLSLLATHACSRHPIRFSLYPSWAPDAVHDGIYCRILGSCSFPYFWKLHISINSHFAVVVISMLLLVKLCCGCTSFVVHPWVSSLWNVKNSSKLNPSFASGYSSVLATPSSIQFVSKLGTWRCAWWNLLSYFGKLLGNRGQWSVLTRIVCIPGITCGEAAHTLGTDGDWYLLELSLTSSPFTMSNTTSTPALWN